tara:strand:- start:623 stop:1003 length:381 start_codon:yes stop_codon:yes gene_type:complete
MAQLPSLRDLQSTNSALELEIAHLRVFVKLTNGDSLQEAEHFDKEAALEHVVLAEMKEALHEWLPDRTTQSINVFILDVNTRIEKLKEEMDKNKSSILSYLTQFLVLDQIRAKKEEADQMHVQAPP